VNILLGSQDGLSSVVSMHLLGSHAYDSVNMVQFSEHRYSQGLPW
jgi:hypothetical protein